MAFKDKREQMNNELQRFISTLNEILPRYTNLLKKTELTPLELSELGEMEYFLIEINSKIVELKKILEHDLFGLSIDRYYQLKQEAKSGNIQAKKKLDKMRESFNESLKNTSLIDWN
jgi:hypothetical protein